MIFFADELSIDSDHHEGTTKSPIRVAPGIRDTWESLEQMNRHARAQLLIAAMTASLVMYLANAVPLRNFVEELVRLYVKFVA
jgi:hypothetical protein